MTKVDYIPDSLKGLINFILFIGYLIVTPREDLCRVEIAQQHFSPNKEFKAVIYQYDCGATTPFTTNVSVLAADEAIEYELGNVFSAQYGSVKGDWHGPFAELKWENNNTIQLSYVNDAEISQKVNSLADITIKYMVIDSLLTDKQRTQTDN